MSYEKAAEPLASRPRFLQRLFEHGVLAVMLIIISLFFGACGYAYFEHMQPLDAFANAAMIASGMGPLAPLQTNGGRIFGALYALYSGLLLIALSGLLLAPFLHRVMHRLHVDE